MPTYLKNAKWISVGVLLVGTLFALILFTARERREVTAAEGFVSTLLYPLQAATDWVVDSTREFGRGVRDLLFLRQDNRRLRAEVERLTRLEVENRELVAENGRLRDMAGIVASSERRLLGAQVIGRNPDSWFRTVIINRGSRDGLTKDMAVINYQGLVGRVIRVTQFTATVQLIIEQGSGIGGMDQATREVGTVSGMGFQGLKISFFQRDASVAAGDPIVTSGLGSVVPKGLFIGTVQEVGRENFDLIKFAVIRPAVDFAHLEEILVVVTTKEQHEEGGP